jgi:diguanylate cyclase (GGDEF)-like protein/PAS domain S-box-containing protein
MGPVARHESRVISRADVSPSSWETEVLEWIPDGILVVDETGRILYVNRQAERLTGYRRRELLRRPVELLVPASLRTMHREERRGYTARPRPRTMGSVDRDFRLRRKNGSELVADIALGPIGRPGSHFTVATIRDATERIRLEKDLKHRALHDPLTGLANRALFFDRLHQAMLGSKRDRRPVAVVMLDLDGFKTVNDAFGHVAGDHVLKKVSAQLQAGVRSTDTVARIGGDEFAWILPSVGGLQAALRKVRMLLRSVARDYSADRKRVEVGVSAGIAFFPIDGRNVDALMRHADLALYTAKRQGGGLAFIAHRVSSGRAASARSVRRSS